MFGHGYLGQFETLRQDTFLLRDAGTPGDITHTMKVNAVYELPFGQGHAIGGNANGLVDRLIGGWAIAVTSQFRSGRLIDLGNLRLVGMTQAEVQDMFTLRFDDAWRKVWMLPPHVIDQTIAAFSVSATSPTGYSGAAPTGRYFAPANGPDCLEVDNGADYGACGGRSLVATGPMCRQTDIRFSKRTRIIRNTSFELGIQVVNAFNQANFVPVSGFNNPGGGQLNNNGSNIANYEVTTLTGTNTSRLVEIVSRFSW